jgi:hypothetical protein
MDVTPETTVASIRTMLFERWPGPFAHLRPDAPSGVRLFCMGRPLEGTCLSECKLPVFDFPTPVHVAAKPSSRPRPAAAAPRLPGDPGKGDEK